MNRPPSPQRGSPPPPSFPDVIERNVTAMQTLRRQDEGRQTVQDRIADGITRFTGSMTFVYLHLAVIGGWVVLNLGWLGVKPFDPYPFGLLTMAGSLEAIFLSTFVLISQNRMSAADARRAELDLQVNMLTEHELTQLIRLTNAIAGHLGIGAEDGVDVREAMHDVHPEEVARIMEHGDRQPSSPSRGG